MTITPRDIDIFILTYNRCKFLKESVQSVLNQSVKDISITIIDNASTDETESYVKSLVKNHPNIKYIRNKENKGSEYSYNVAKELADKTLMMCFHDDDILHPKYIEIALKYFNKYPSLNILSTDCHTPETMSNGNWEDVSDKAVYCSDYVELASLMFYEGTFAYPAVIYRTSNVKETKFSKKKFGKIDDKPRCVEICKGGSALVLMDKHFLRYRIHEGQDSLTSSTGPFYNEIINFNIYFKDILCTKKFSYNRLYFILRNIEYLIYCYNMGKDESLSFKDFVYKAYKEGGACYFSKLLFNKYLKYLCRKLHHRLRRKIKPKRKIVCLSENN